MKVLRVVLTMTQTIMYNDFSVRLRHDFGEYLSNIESAVSVGTNKYNMMDIVSFAEYIRADDELTKIDKLKETYIKNDALDLFDCIVESYRYTLSHSLDEYYALLRMSLANALNELRD